MVSRRSRIFVDPRPRDDRRRVVVPHFAPLAPARYRWLLMRRNLWLIDLACVVVFVGVGRSVHAHGLSIAGMASTSWPFVTGLAAGWIAVHIGHASGAAIIGGIVVASLTVVVGMALRVLVGQGTAVAFILVAFGFLGATMVGWRSSALILAHARRADRGP